ncbi:MAG: metallophosphoesterase [bacterium]|nr:metallophosphoesterase [bacterium]
MNIRLAATLLLSILLLSSCIRPSQEGAEMDLLVGKGEVAGAIISSGDGLATIQELSSGNITFWAQAPVVTVSLDLTGSSVTEWNIIIKNAMPDTELRSSQTGMSSVVQTPTTGKEYSLSFTADSQQAYTLTFDPTNYDVEESFTFAMMADVQRAFDEVGEIYTKINETSARFVCFPGDLTSTGSREELQAFVEKTSLLNIPVYFSPGNHDLGGDVSDWFELIGRRSFHFSFKGVEFTMVDSSTAYLDPLVYGWLDSWVDNNINKTHFFFTHIPPLDPFGIRNGSFRSRNEAYKLLAILAEGRVDATFYGHIHSLYEFTNAGIKAYISGGGGAIPERFDGIGRHFLTVTANPSSGMESVQVNKVD